VLLKRQIPVGEVDAFLADGVYIVNGKKLFVK
jgi:hypothetical protein